MEKILVTGGGGLIGSNLCLKLAERGCTLKATCHNRKPLVQNELIEYISADLTKLDECEQVLTGVKNLFVCSALKFSAGQASKHLDNVYNQTLMTLNLLEAAKRMGVEKIVTISSVAVYPESSQKITENQIFEGDTLPNIFVYGWNKRIVEVLSRIYEKETDMKVVVIRPTAVYGPYDDFNLKTSYVMPALVRKVVEWKTPIEVWGTGEEIRDFVYAEDVAEAMLLAMEKAAGGESFNIASGHAVSIKELVYKILAVCGHESSKNDIYFNTSRSSNKSIYDVSTQKARDVLGFVPKTSLEEGIKKTVEWYQADII